MAVVGVWALTALDRGSSETPGIALVAVVTAALVLLLRSRLSLVRTAGSLLLVAVVVAVLGLLDLVAVLSDLDELADYGGVAGLVGLVFYFGGGVVMLWGAVGLVRSVGPAASPEPVGLAERLIWLGGVVLIVAWVLMVLAPGWVLTSDQALGVVAATAGAVLGYLRRNGTSPLSPRGTRIALVVAAALVMVTGVSGLFAAATDWDFIVLVGGAPMYLPFIVYLLGAVLLTAGGIMTALDLVRASGKVGTAPVVAAVAVLLGAAVFTAWRDARPEPSTTSIESAPSSEGRFPATPVALEGPQFAPVEGCSLITPFEVYEAVAPAYQAEATLEVSGSGPFRDGPEREMVREGCKWTYYPTSEAWADSQSQFEIEIGPGERTDFAPGAKLGREEPAEGVAVSGVGDLAMWFPTEHQGIISVAQETRLGVVFVRLLVRHPDLDDSARLEIAKGLADKVVERLENGPLEPVEVDLCDLLTAAEAEEVLGPYREGTNGAGDALFGGVSPGVVDLTRPGDESCKYSIPPDVEVEVATGLPTGFGAADLDGVAGEPVAGVGDEAIWFGGDLPGRGGTGVLNARQGHAHLRIGLTLPDTPGDQRLEIAKYLAIRALSRLRGDSAVVIFDHEPLDRASLGFVENLLTKEEEGEWTQGEGLVATLELLAGEADPAEVLRHMDLVEREGTGILKMANWYLENGPDGVAKAEIARLIDMLVYTSADLEAMAGIGPATASRSGVYTFPVAQQGETNCAEFFGGNVPEGVGKCLEFKSTNIGGKIYRVFYPASSMPSAGWTTKHYELALLAMEESVGGAPGLIPGFGQLGRMPSVDLVFSVFNDPEAYAQASPFSGEPCAVVLYTSLLTEMEGDFKQVIAHELAHCFQEETFTEQNRVPYEVVKWREEGLAEFLSNVIYPTNNLEWTFLDEMERTELSTTLMERDYENFLFFQFLENRVGVDGVLDVVRSLPGSGGSPEQARALAAYPGMFETYHDFAKGLTDRTITDTGGQIIPYDADFTVAPISAVASPFLEEKELDPFSVFRYLIRVDEGSEAVLDYIELGLIQESARPLEAPEWSTVPSMLPDAACRPESIVVASSVDDRVGQVSGRTDIANFRFDVPEYVDDPDSEDCEEDYEPPPPPDCPLADVCIGISDYYRFLEQLAEWFRCLMSESCPE